MQQIEALQAELDAARQANERLAQQNMRLVLLNKEKDQKLYKCELVIRRYRTRLVRWFEDMTFDPLEQPELMNDAPEAQPSLQMQLTQQVVKSE